MHLHYTRQSAAKSSISGRPSQYPFSGILVCDHCGSLMFVYGKGTGRRYRCTGNAKRGICTNRLSVLESTARTCLLNGLRKHLTNGSIGNARRATCTGPHCSRGSVPRWFRGSARDARRPAASGGAVMAWCQKPTR